MNRIFLLSAIFISYSVADDNGINEPDAVPLGASESAPPSRIRTRSWTTARSSTMYVLTTTAKPKITKMIKLFGKATSSTQTRSTQDDFNIQDCINDCYDSQTCILAYMDFTQECRHFDFIKGNSIEVEEVSGENNEIAAFRPDLDDIVCPLHYNSITIGGKIPVELTKDTWPRGGKVNIYKWEKTTTG